MLRRYRRSVQHMTMWAAVRGPADID